MDNISWKIKFNKESGICKQYVNNFVECLEVNNIKNTLSYEKECKQYIDLYFKNCLKEISFEKE